MVSITGSALRLTTSARPSTFIIDKTGIITYMYIGTHQFDLVQQTEVLESLKAVAQP